jgi:DNA-binding NarL/FixJ family response regulator
MSYRMHSGAQGCVLKARGATDLVAAVEAVLEGRQLSVSTLLLIPRWHNYETHRITVGCCKQLQFIERSIEV